MFKKSTERRLSHETSALKRFFQIVLIAVLAVGVLAGFWLLTKLGPQDVDYRKMNQRVEVSEELLALKAESIKLEAQFEAVLGIREAEAQDIALLKVSLDRLEQYLNQYPGFDSDASKRQRNIRQRYQDIVGSNLKIESLELEAEAEILAKEKKYEVAWQKYQQAHEKQNIINEDFPISSAYDISRATRLDRVARYLMAQPLYERSLGLETQADASIELRNWREAEEFLHVAISIQDQLNREYRGINQASVSRLEQLREKLVGIRSGQSYVAIERVSDLADASRAAGENLEAADLYLEAARLQRQLNELYPNSQYASFEKVSEFQRKAQTTESFELGRDIERNHNQLKKLLSERRTYEAAELIALLRQDLRQMEDVYPRSSLNDDELQVKIRYLNLVQKDLEFIQGRVYGALLSIPEEGDWRMLRTEVSQALYLLIMGTNPSRNLSDMNPVDSVSWSEAKSFCDRLSWILGQPVRLPSEHEFRQALGPLRFVVLEDHVWSAASAEGIAQRVGLKAPFASGYYDLLGNVSEWLESLDRFDNEDARHIGGHARDRLEAIFKVPMREAARGERNRMTGFRFVVKVASPLQP